MTTPTITELYAQIGAMMANWQRFLDQQMGWQAGPSSANDLSPPDNNPANKGYRVMLDAAGNKRQIMTPSQMEKLVADAVKQIDDLNPVGLSAQLTEVRADANKIAATLSSSRAELTALADSATASKDAAASSATSASSSKTAAASSASAALSSKNAAATSATAAASSATAAASSRDVAATKATESQASAVESANKAADAASSASSAATKAGEAATSAATASTKAGEAATSATAASTKAGEAAASATAAATSATAAKTSETNANTKASAAASSAVTSQKWADNAVDSAVTTGKFSALHHATKASESAAAAAASASTSLAKASEASGYASSASTSASTATTKASEAATGASTATTKAAAAASSATSAASSATAAGNSATAAANSATAASNSASSASSSKTAAASSAADAAASAQAAREAMYVSTGALIEAGDIDMSSGSYPSPLKDAAGKTLACFWKVTTAGISSLDGVDYEVGDTLVYSSASSKFYKIDNTESVQSVNGMKGAVRLTAADVGALAATATATAAAKLAVARTITIAGDGSGSASFDGTSNVSINLTVADDSHAHTFANLKNRPTTLAGFGITDAASSSHVHADLFSKSGGSITGQTLVNIASGPTIGGTSFDNGWLKIGSSSAGIAFDPNEIAVSGNDLSFGTITNNIVSLVVNNVRVGEMRADGLYSMNSKVLTEAAGSAVSAGKLATARALALTGDATGSLTFDGSADASMAVTLADSGVTAGTFTKVTVDAKGRVTAATTQTAADIPALDWSKITSGKPTNLTGYGVSSATLKAIEGLAMAADKAIYFTAAGTAAVMTMTGAARALLDDADSAAMRATLGAASTSAATTTANGLMSAADKAKLDSVQASANAYVHPASGVAAGSYRTVTVDANGHVTGGSNPTTLNDYGITDAAPSSHVGSGGTAHASASPTMAGFMSAADKAKLDGIGAGANNYTHPTSDGSLHVPATGTTSNGKVLKAGATAGSFSWASLTPDDVGLSNVNNWPFSTATNDPSDTTYATAGAVKRAADIANAALPKAGGSLTGSVTFTNDSVLQWSRNTDAAAIGFKNSADSDTDSFMWFRTSDNGNEYFKWQSVNGATTTDLMTLKSDNLRIKGDQVYHQGFKPTAAELGVLPSDGTAVNSGGLKLAYRWSAPEHDFNSGGNTSQDLKFYWHGSGNLNGPTDSIGGKTSGYGVTYGNGTHGGQFDFGYGSWPQFRSLINGNWSEWNKLYHTGFKPTPADIGAAVAGIFQGEGYKILGPTHLLVGSEYKFRWYKVCEWDLAASRIDQTYEIDVHGDTNYAGSTGRVRVNVSRYEKDPQGRLHVVVTPVHGNQRAARVYVTFDNDKTVVWARSARMWGSVSAQAIGSPNGILTRPKEELTGAFVVDGDAQISGAQQIPCHHTWNGDTNAIEALPFDGGEVFDSGNRVYSASYRPTLRDINGGTFSGNLRTDVNDAVAIVADRAGYRTAMGNSIVAGEYIFGGMASSASDYQHYIRLGNNKFQYHQNGSNFDVYHTGNKPTATDVGALPLSANATSATKLATARTISATGDAVGSASFDGTANAAIALTLANSGVTAGTYGKVTVDAKGRVTAGMAMAAADIPNLDWSKITTGKPTTLAGYGITDALGINANAVSASKLATARTINGTNFDGTASITTANWGTARTLTIGGTAKSVNGASDVAWSLDEIGAAPAGHGIGGSGLLKANANEIGNSSGVYASVGDAGVNFYNKYGPLLQMWREGGADSTGQMLQIQEGAGALAFRTRSSNNWTGWTKVYTEQNKPTSADVGLGSVNNWAATAAINDASDTKYATAGAVKKAYDLAAAALPSNKADVFKSAGMLTDLNVAAAAKPGFFQYSPGAVGAPMSGYGHGLVVSTGGNPGSGNWYQQIAFGHDSKIYTRRGVNSAATGAWARIYTTDDKPSLEELGAAAAAHTHTYSLRDIKDSPYKEGCDCATTGNLSAAYANGSSGVGATLTNNSTLAALTIDGVACSVGMRVLVKNQTSAAQNGIYTVTKAGSTTEAWVLTRTPGCDTPAEAAGAVVTVDQGTENGGLLMTTEFKRSSTIGSTVMNWRVVVDGGNIGTQHHASGVTAGTYRSVTVNAQGHVTGGSNPTTLSGYGITDAQAKHTNLTALSGPTPAADRIPYFTSASAASVTPLTAFARSLLDDNDAAAARATLGVLSIEEPFKSAADVATTADLAATYANGSSGVGATLTASAAAALVLDGVTCSVGMRVLVKNQTAAAQNGVYTVTNAGSSTVAWVLTRATDADTTAKLAGAVVTVDQGTSNGSMLLTNDWKKTSVVGTTAMNWRVVIDSGNVSSYHHASGVTAGTYRSVTVNSQGHVTAGTNPTTLSGYGITDAAPSSHVGSGGGAHAVATSSQHGFMSSTDKAKLDSIASNANNYAHPAGDGNLHVPATGTGNNGKVLMAGATAGSLSWQSISADVVGAVPVAGGAMSGVLTVNNEIRTTSANSMRMVYGNYGTFWRQDGANMYLMFTNAGDQYGSYNSLRPMSANLANGSVNFGHAVDVNGNLSVNTGSTSWIDMRSSAALQSRSAVVTASASAIVRQEHADRHFILGGLGNSCFGVFMINKSRTANGTDAGAYLSADGTWYCGGNVSANDYQVRSDRRLKSEFTEIKDAWDLWKTLQISEYTKEGAREYGFIAQDFEKNHKPAVAMTSTSEYLNLKPMSVLAIAGKVIQSLQDRVEKLENMLNECMKRMEVGDASTS